MQSYIKLVGLISFFVDFLLLLGTNRLMGKPPAWFRMLLAAALGGIYAASCLLPDFCFLGNWGWRLVSLFVIGLIAFGVRVEAILEGGLFLLLHVALGGTVILWDAGSVRTVAAVLAFIAVIALIRFREKTGWKRFVPVELSYGGKHLRLTALRDTGNMLRDPITGQTVLVIGADAANALTGLTVQQLRQPVESMGTLPGLRLVPYKTIGQSAGLLLALKMHEVKIGSQRQSTLVAFAPEKLGDEGQYQALTGGVA